MKCRFDGKPMETVMLDLGHCPPSNSYLTAEQLALPEVNYPLKVFVSERTFYAQVPEFKRATEIFNEDYAYFSSYSTSWLAHCKQYVDKMVQRFKFNKESLILEVASNDGYLLQYFREQGVPCFGVEPSLSVAKIAREKGIETIVDFFGRRLAEQLIKERKKPDLILGNNVFAHVPDINDFIQGLKVLLAPDGIVTLEFPHLLKLIEENQFDTVYHEHYSYFSLYTVKLLTEAHGLSVFDVEELPTHGGSLRVYLKHAENTTHQIEKRVQGVIENEVRAGLTDLNTYRKFSEKAEKVKLGFLKFLIQAKESGKRVAAYGAAAKGNTLLNYCGIKPDLLEFVVDASPFKQGKFLPGSHLPIFAEPALRERRPDYIVILPWNLREEISAQLSYTREWGAELVIAVPELTIVS